MSERIVLGMCCVLLLLGLPASAWQGASSGNQAADVAKEGEEKPVDPVMKELDVVRGMLTNAQAKFNRSAVGVESTNSGEVLTPARRCCSGNLQHIETSIGKIRQMVRERGVCFERKRDREGVEIVNLVNQDLRSLTSAVSMFEEAPAPSDTQLALHNCTRTFLNLLRSLGSLKTCSTQ